MIFISYPLLITRGVDRVVMKEHLFHQQRVLQIQTHMRILQRVPRQLFDALEALTQRIAMDTERVGGLALIAEALQKDRGRRLELA